MHNDSLKAYIRQYKSKEKAERIYHFEEILSSIHILLFSLKIVIYFLQIFHFKSSTKFVIVSTLFTNFIISIQFSILSLLVSEPAGLHFDYSLISKVHNNLHRAISVVEHHIGQPVSPLVSQVRWSLWWFRLAHLSISCSCIS